GLLYGEKDFTKTLEISTRAGQDSDCNPATAAGILGTMIGYSHIPEEWITPLKKAEHRKFSHSEYSLENVYEIGMKHAIENIQKNGGEVLSNGEVKIARTGVEPVALEKNFAGHYPKERIPLNKVFTDSLTFDFTGIG